MNKYIFTQDANFRPVGSSNLGVNFKKGDIIEGVIVRNTKSSEPPSFIEALTPKGKISIGYGGRGGSVVELYNAFAYTPNPKAVDCAKKVGLPSWYTQDPILPRPQVVIDPSLIKQFSDCMQSSNSIINEFIFIKPFSTKIGVGGAVGLNTYSKNKGDTVKGTVVGSDNDKMMGGVEKLKVELSTSPLIQGAQSHVYIPMSFLMSKSQTNNDSTTPTQTNNDLSKKKKSVLTTKNILIGILVVGSVVALLKWKKII
jgi:hypothetical protein